MQDFATIAKPISDLLLGEEAEVPEQKVPKKNGVPSSKKVPWTGNQRDALTELIRFITNPPILAYADFETEFFVHTDASGLGLGAILYQEQKGVTRVIAYASRTLKPAEKRYHSTKLEFVAMKWAICHQFRDYLAYSDQFSVFTDNNPLLFVMTLEKPNASTQRWVSELAEYNFDIHFRPGKVNRDADCLSRLPLDINRYQDLCKETTTLDAFQTMVAAIRINKSPKETELLAPTEDSSEATEKMKQDQEEDEYIHPVRRIIMGDDKAQMQLTPLSNILLRCKDKLYIDQHGLLCRRTNYFSQIVLPLKHRDVIYDSLHTQMGHLGSERTFQLARQRVYWPRMEADIEEFTRKTCRCLIQRKSRQ